MGSPIPAADIQNFLNNYITGGLKKPNFSVSVLKDISSYSFALLKEFKSISNESIADYEAIIGFDITDYLDTIFKSLFGRIKDTDLFPIAAYEGKPNSFYLSNKTKQISVNGIYHVYNRLRDTLIGEYKSFVTKVPPKLPIPPTPPPVKMSVKRVVTQIIPGKIALATSIKGLKLQAENIQQDLLLVETALKTLLSKTPLTINDKDNIEILSKRKDVLETQFNLVSSKLREEERELGILSIKAKKQKLKEKIERKRKEDIEMDQREELEDAIRKSVSNIAKQFGGVYEEESKRNKLAKDINKTVEKLAKEGVEYQGRGMSKGSSKKKIMRLLEDFTLLMEEEGVDDEEVFLRKLKKLKQHFVSKKKSKKPVSVKQRAWFDMIDKVSKNPKYKDLSQAEKMKIAAAKYKKSKE